MNISQLITRMAITHRLDERTPASIVDLFLKEAARALIQEGGLELGDFGTFAVKNFDSGSPGREGTYEKEVMFYAGSMFDHVGEKDVDFLTPTQLKALLAGL